MFGCIYKRKKGSRHILTYPGAKRAVVIPEYEEVDVEIIKNNMRTVGMTREQHSEILIPYFPKIIPLRALRLCGEPNCYNNRQILAYFI